MTRDTIIARLKTIDERMSKEEILSEIERIIDKNTANGREVRVALCVGHNKKFQGAVGANGVSEWVFNKKVAGAVAQNLASDNIKVRVFYRQPIRSYSTQMRELHKELAEWGADIAVELHFNAVENESVNGHEVLYCSTQGSVLAKCINDAFEAHEISSPDRGIVERKTGDGAGFLCRGKAVCVIGEPFFAPHIAEVSQKQLAVAYADGIRDYIKK